MAAPDFWNDQNTAKEISAKCANLKKDVKSWDTVKSDIDEYEELLELTDADDSAALTEIETAVNALKFKFEELESLNLLNQPMDEKNCYLTIHSGAGGTESCDWVDMLFRMYLRWTEIHKFSTEIIDRLDGEEAGLKNVTILVKGHQAYGLLRNEMGVHRLVRISPFDSNSRRHTSFASVDCLPELDDSIEVEVDEKDLKIDTYRSQGAGGQHVNTTDSAVRITHLPTGIVVTCQNERSQHKNRATAMKMLKGKLFALEEEKRLQALATHNETKRIIAWGSQIRSYVFHPYTLVKDHRTNIEIGSVQAVMDGELDKFIYGFMRYKAFGQS